MPNNRYDWVANRLTEVKSVRCAVLFSADGMVTGKSESLHQDDADRLGANGTGLMSLAMSVARDYGTPPPPPPSATATVQQLMTQFDGGILFVRVAADGTRMAVITAEDADPGLIAFEMAQLVKQLGTETLSTPARAGAASHEQP